MSGFDNEIYVNQHQIRWIDRLSPAQYKLLLVAAVVVPTFSALGLARTIKAWQRHRDAKMRVTAGKMFLKNVAAFNHKFYPYLLPRVKIGAPMPRNYRGEEKVMFPNLSDLKGLGKGVTEYNWRNGDFQAVQKSLKRVDMMTAQELWTFTTLYTLVSNQKPAYELVDKILRWVIKGEASLDDLRAANIPEAAKYDLPPDLMAQYEREGWKTVQFSKHSADDFAKRYSEAESEYRKKGGRGLFTLKGGDYQENMTSDQVKEAQEQSRNV